MKPKLRFRICEDESNCFGVVWAVAYLGEGLNRQQIIIVVGQDSRGRWPV